MNDGDQPTPFSPQVTPHPPEGNTLRPNLVMTPDVHMQQDSFGPINSEDANFPPLPSGPTYRKVGPHKPRLGKVRLTLGRKKPRVSDSTKRPQPSSPMSERSPKRHTSTAVPPLGTSILQTVQPSQDIILSPSPPPNAQIQQPVFSFGRDFGLARSMSQANDPNASDDPMDVTRGMSEIPDQSNTAVGNSAWDNILVDSSIGSPCLNPTLGMSPVPNIATPWNTQSQNPPAKHGHNDVNSLGLSNVHDY